MAAEITTTLTVFFSALLFSYLFSERFGFPVIPVYILSGIVLSLFLHPAELHIFEKLGVILLLFYIGLEFSLAEMEKNFKNILSVGLVDLLLNTIPVFLVCKLFGLDNLTSFVVSVILYPSSSAIVSKLLIDLRKLANPEVEPVLAILVFEDIAAATLLAILVNLSGGSGEPSEVAKAGVKIALFIALTYLFVKNFNKVIDFMVARYGTAGEFLILLIGTLLFILVEAAMGFGLSEAIGAFAAGTLFAESSHKERIEQVVVPYRDLFGSLFFLSFGLTIDVSQIGKVSFLFLGVFLAVSFITKLITGVAAARLYRLSVKRGVSAGLMLLPRGEFSILVAATRPELVPFTAAYVLLSSILGSFAVRESEKIISIFFKKKVKKRKSTLRRSDLV